MWTADTSSLDTTNISGLVRLAVAGGAWAYNHPLDGSLITVSFSTEATGLAFVQSVRNATGVDLELVEEPDALQLGVDKLTFFVDAGANTVVSTISHNLGSGAVISLVGAAPSALALSGSTIVRTSSAATNNVEYPVRIRVQSGDGKHAIEETFAFVCRAIIQVTSGNVLTDLNGQSLTDLDGEVLINA